MRSSHIFVIGPGIPPSSPFCKGGLRGIFLIQAGLIEDSHILRTNNPLFSDAQRLSL